jgi:hypothetical protein
VLMWNIFVKYLFCMIICILLLTHLMSETLHNNICIFKFIFFDFILSVL